MKYAGRLRITLVAGCLALSMLPVAASPAYASVQNTGELRGRVIDAHSEAPISGAEISFVQVDFVVHTDEAGAYAITNIPVGRYSVLVRQAGFKSAYVSEHVVFPDRVTILDFRLTPTDVQPEPAGPSYAVEVFDRQNLPERVDLSPSDAEVLYVVDGTVVSTPSDGQYNTSDIQCMEIRRGPAAAQSFNRSIRTDPRRQSYRNVVLVWTLSSRSPMPQACRRDR